MYTKFIGLYVTKSHTYNRNSVKNETTIQVQQIVKQTLNSKFIK